MTTFYPKHRVLVTDQQLRAARRRMHRTRHLDRLSWRYRHVVRIAATVGLITTLAAMYVAGLTLIGS